MIKIPILLDEYHPEQLSKMNDHLESDQYVFHRFNDNFDNFITSYGHPFGPFLYKNQRTGLIMSSFEAPNNNKYVYSFYDIGCNTDALAFYLNT